MASSSPSTIMEHQELTAVQLDKINDLMASANPSTHASKIAENLVWKLQVNPADPELPHIFPGMKGVATEDPNNGITIMMPAIKPSFACVDAKTVSRFSDGVDSTTITFKPIMIENSSSSEIETFKNYFDAWKILKKFFCEDLAKFLVDNIDKHGYFAQKQTSTLQKCIKQSKESAYEKVIDWITDGDYKTIHEYKPGYAKKKLIGNCKSGQKTEEANEYDSSGAFSAYLNANADKQFQYCDIYCPDGSKLPLSEFSKVHTTDGVFSSVIWIRGLNKSKYAGGGLSIVSTLKRLQIISNGIPYGSGGGSGSSANAINVFDILSNKDSTESVPVSVNITGTSGNSTIKMASEAREALKKRPAKTSLSEKQKKKIKSDPTIASEDEL